MVADLEQHEQQYVIAKRSNQRRRFRLRECYCCWGLAATIMVVVKAPPEKVVTHTQPSGGGGSGSGGGGGVIPAERLHRDGARAISSA